MDKEFRDLVKWATAATKYTTSWFHIDDQGFATSIEISDGIKYWVLARPSKADESFGTWTIFEDWHPSDVDGRFQLEGLVLEPGCVL